MGLDRFVVAPADRCDFFAGSPENEGVDATNAAGTEDEYLGHQILTWCRNVQTTLTFKMFIDAYIVAGDDVLESQCSCICTYLQ
jgi:hypothetical protein